MSEANATAGAEIAPGMSRHRPVADFDTIFHEYWSRVHGVIFRLTGDREEAQDLALDVFVRLHGDAPRLSDDGALAGWLYRVATRLGLNAIRARKRRSRNEGDAARHLAIDGEDADRVGDEEVERQERRIRVRQVLASMPPRSASLLVLRHSGLSYREIASSLNLSPGSIGTLLARAERDFEARYRAGGVES